MPKRAWQTPQPQVFLLNSEVFRPVFLDLHMENTWGVLLTCRPIWSVRVCISNELPVLPRLLGCYGHFKWEIETIKTRYNQDQPTCAPYCLLLNVVLTF